jgi:glutamate-1-semialdehyde 2,1-aminomutase
MAAGIATLDELKKNDYAALEQRVASVAAELQAILRKKGVPAAVPAISSMLTVFFTAKPVTDFESAKTGDANLYTAFYQQMREQGIYLAPSPYEATMFSFAHSDDDLQRLLSAAENVRFE